MEDRKLQEAHAEAEEAQISALEAELKPSDSEKHVDKLRKKIEREFKSAREKNDKNMVSDVADWCPQYLNTSMVFRTMPKKISSITC